MHAEAPGVHWYCNVTTPAVYGGGVLTWTDLGIDVEVYPGGEVALDDLPEFLEVREALPAGRVCGGGEGGAEADGGWGGRGGGCFGRRGICRR